MSATATADALHKALKGVDNPTAAGRALGAVLSRFEPEYETARTAFRHEAEKALAPYFGSAAKAKPTVWALFDNIKPSSNGKRAHKRNRSGDGLVVLQDVKPERVTWLWPGRIPLGKLTILDGDPGLGKSTLTLDLAARISTGAQMPDGAPSDLDGPAGTVLLTAEDGLADTVRPRLDAAEADCARVAALRFVAEDRLPSVQDVEEIAAAIQAVDARLLIIDPLVAFLGAGVNSHRDQDVREGLAGLAELAETLGVAVVSVRHLNKGQAANPLYRGGGSIAFIGAARSGLLVGQDPDDETGELRILAPTKSNLAARPPSLAYRLQPTPGGVRIAWRGESEHSAARLLAAPDGEARTALEEAKGFLNQELENGPLATQEVQKRAKQAGHAWATIRRAADVLRVQKLKLPGKFSGGWEWSLREVAHHPWATSQNDDVSNIGGTLEGRGLSIVPDDEVAQHSDMSNIGPKEPLLEL